MAKFGLWAPNLKSLLVVLWLLELETWMYNPAFLGAHPSPFLIQIVSFLNPPGILAQPRIWLGLQTVRTSARDARSSETRI